MSNRIVILCVEDEPEVRDSIVRDLQPFAEIFRIEAAEDVADARQVLQECMDEGDRIGLALCDHVLPGETGVSFLVELNHDEATKAIRRVLITGQAGQEDTIQAVNEGGLDYYITKPWQPDTLRHVVRDQLTEFVLGEEDDLLPYVALLDSQRLLEAVSQHQSDS